MVRLNFIVRSFGRNAFCDAKRVRHMSNEAARLGVVDPNAALVSL
jgi:hypothetical protein